MKVRNIGNLLSYSIVLQIATTVTCIDRTSSKKPDEGFDYEKPLEALKNSVFPSKLKISLLINARETSLKMDLPVSHKLALSKKIDLRKPLVFLIHGFLASGGENWLKELANAYLERRNVNVFIVDWKSGAMTLNFFGAVAKVGPVAKELISFIKLLIKKYGVKASRIHLIGHSLGAHIAGNVGRSFSKLYRVTGLDPAGSKFFSNSTARLSNSDATYVDVVHTSNVFGSSDRLGQVDFYINNGGMQPGCMETDSFTRTENLAESFIGNVCSHSRAYQYYTESIKNPKCLFIATQTKDEASKVGSSDFDEESHTTMGLDTFENQARGAVYVVTNDKPPYCRRFQKK